jgi:hypothetical protein
MPRVRRNEKQQSKSWGESFMRLRVKKVGEGLHPNEIVVEVTTTTGAERLVLDKRSLVHGTISVGAPVARSNGSKLLVELPREAMSGVWRVWVKKAQLTSETDEAYAA